MPANVDKRLNNYKPKNNESLGGDEAGAIGVEILLGNVDVDLVNMMNQNTYSDDAILATHVLQLAYGSS